MAGTIYANELLRNTDLAVTPGGRIGDASPLGGGKRKLSDYEREVAHALIRKGHDRRTAIRIARGVIDRAAVTGRWARGKAKPSVVAGAVASVTQRNSFSAGHKLSESELDEIIDLADNDADDTRPQRPRSKSRRRGRIRRVFRRKSKLPTEKKPHERQARMARLAQQELARRIITAHGMKREKLHKVYHRHVYDGDGPFRPVRLGGAFSEAHARLLDLAVREAELRGLDIDLVWTEALHPRDYHGRFAFSSGARARASKVAAAQRVVKVNRARQRVLNTHRARSTEAKDAAYQAHVQRADALLQSDKAKALDTTKLYAKPNEHGGVTFNRARSEQQRDIVKRVLAQQIAHGAKAEHKAVFLGGLPGAGKTRALGKIPGLDPKDYVTVNPDLFKEELAKRGMIPKLGNLSPMEASSLAHEESSLMALMLAEEARKRGLNIIHDITMNKVSSVTSRLEPLKESGYHTHAVFVDIPYALSQSRVERRHRGGYEARLADKSGKHLGERLVPSSYGKGGASSKGSTSANRDAFEEVKHHFHAYRLYNNFNGNPNEFPMTEVESRGKFQT